MSAARLARWFAHPAAMLLLPLLCLGYTLLGGPQMGLNLLLSILSITTTQLVLYVGGKRDEAMHAKLDELVRAIPDADDKLIGIEDTTC